MTNYYNILGLEQDADLGDIKTAYRKLSKKFHPDLNPDDDFFNKMFLQIQEAYEVLSNEDLRYKYDGLLLNSNRRGFDSVERSKTIKPEILNFSVDKQEVEQNEEFTVTWETRNADFVQIRPMGIFEAEGYEKFQFSTLKGEAVNLVIIATDTQTGLSARKHIVIQNKKWKPSFFEDDRKTDLTIKALKIIFILLLLTLLILILIYGIEKQDPLEEFR